MTETPPSPRSPTVEGFALGPFATNCYLVHSGHGSEGWIVDASFDPEPLIERARALELRIVAVLLTHAHVDHIAGLRGVHAAFPDAPILIHPEEERWLNDPELNLSAGYGVPITAPDASGALRHGDTLELGETTWRVLHTPGHSPGSVTFHCAPARIAIVGDTLFAGSIGRSDFPTSDEATLHRSIRETLYTLPDDTRALPGHGPATTIGREKRSNPFVRAEPAR